MQVEIKNFGARWGLGDCSITSSSLTHPLSWPRVTGVAPCKASFDSVLERI